MCLVHNADQYSSNRDNYTGSFVIITSTLFRKIELLPGLLLLIFFHNVMINIHLTEITTLEVLSLQVHCSGHLSLPTDKTLLFLVHQVHQEYNLQCFLS